MARATDKSAYEILKHPFSSLRQKVASKFFAMNLTMDDFVQISEALLEEAKQNDQISAADLSVELKKAYGFLKHGDSKDTPIIDHSAKQLVWGMALACSQSDPKIRQSWPASLQGRSIQQLKVWNDIKNSVTARTELRRHALLVNKMSFLQEDEIAMRWGACTYPNVGFYFDKEHNRINLDLLWGLIGGFEHSRAMQLHEIGHAYGTLTFGKKMGALKKEFDRLNEKARKRQISKEEYRRLQAVEREHRFRFLIFDEAENSYANRFAANTSEFGLVRQDIGYDLNAVETQLFSVGENLEKNKDGIVPVEDTIQNRAYNLKQAIRLSFFVNNGIVADKPEEWQKLGVNIDWISYKTPEGETVSGEPAFKKLREMTSSLEGMQIKERDYYKSDEDVYKIALQYAEQRADRIDEIFDLFAMQYYEELMHNKDQENQDNIEQNNRMQNQQGQQGEGQQGESQEGEGQQGEGQQGESQEGEGQQGEGQQGEGQEGEAQQGEGQQGESQEGEGQQGEGQQGEGQQGEGQGGEGQEGEGQEGEGQQGKGQQGEGQGGEGQEGEGQEGEGQEGEGQEGEGQQGEGQEGEGQEGEGQQGESQQGSSSRGSRQGQPGASGGKQQDGIDQEGEGEGSGDAEDQEQEQRNWDDLSEEEKQKCKEDKNGNIRKDDIERVFEQPEDPGEDMKPLEERPETPEEVYRQKIIELTKDLGEEENDNQDNNQKSSQEQGENDDFQNVMEIIRSNPEKEAQADGNVTRSFSPGGGNVPFEMPKTLMPENEFSKIISDNMEMVEQLKAKFIDLQNKYYDETDDVEVRSLRPEAGNLKVDLPSYIERLKKQAKGEELKEADFENFIVRNVGKDQTKAPIDIAILIDNSGSMQSARTDTLAIELACTIFQATRDNPAFNVYVAMMHVPTTWIAKPGDNSIEISERLATVYHSRQCGDDKIGHNIPAVLQEIQDRDVKDKREGLCNFFMITDGDHTDGNSSFALVNDIIEKSDNVTFNWLLTEDIRSSYAKRIIEEHETGVAGKRVDYEDNITHQNMLEKMMSLIEKRVEDAKHIEAIRTQEKQSDISGILDAIKKRYRGYYDD